MAKNYSEKVENLEPYKQINERLSKLPSKLLLGGKLTDTQPIILTLSNFYRPKVVESVNDGVETSMMARRMFDTFLELYNASPNNYTKALINTINNDNNFMFTLFPYGQTVSLNKMVHKNFVNSVTDTRKLAHETLNISLAGAESYILFTNLTANLEYDDPKTIEVAKKVMDLYEFRVLNADQGLQKFGKFKTYPIILNDFLDYYYDDVTLSNFSSFVQRQKTAIKNKEFSDISPEQTLEKNK